MGEWNYSTRCLLYFTVKKESYARQAHEERKRLEECLLNGED